ncbi:PIN domain-containing protein [Nocardia fusca]|uniref:PIN domain-containing protein n=1 Tax=Nocardia fusca TaxID=941183 RepID=UPI0007A76131|nr:PIN domain-containing protein [Nocardia fusca]
MTIVVVDTNILADSPKLKSEEWRSLIQNRDRWELQFVVPEVVLMETIDVVRRGWRKRRQEVSVLKVGEFGLNDMQESMLAEIDKCSAEYEQWLRDYLESIDAAIVPPPPTDLMVLARRASETRPPYSPRGKDGKVVKDGLRDTLIWLTVMAIAEDNADEEVWFISDNHLDFGPKADSWTGDGTGERDDCPILFHRALIAELESRGLAGRVRYVLSARRLEQYFAAMFSPISDADLTQLVDHLDKSVLAERLVEAARWLILDPEQTALPLPTRAAHLVGAREPLEGWEFSEGAGRGEAGWTARFAVDTEVDVDLLREDQDALVGGEETKVLRLFGDITVSKEGDIRDIEVTSAEALPDDPMRARWTRRASRAQVEADTMSFLADYQFPNVAETMAKQVQMPNIAELVTRQFPPPAGIAELAARQFQLPAGIADLAAQQLRIPEIAKIVDEANKAHYSVVAEALEQARKVQASGIADIVAQAQRAQSRGAQRGKASEETDPSDRGDEDEAPGKAEADE